MAVGGRGFRVVVNEAELDLLFSKSGPVGRDLQAKAERVTQEAKRLAPVSPHGSGGRPSGYLRSQIGYEIGADAEGLYADIASPATTETGSPYGLFQEVGTAKMDPQPHLRPALDIIDHT
ncbi:MAG: hypothetical protein ACRDUA_08950 [Micromonosporaceae bacterium]